MSAAGFVVWRLGKRGGRLGEAELSYNRGDFAAAAEAAKARLVERPGDSEATRVLARASARLGRDDAALGLFGRLEPTSLTAEDYTEIGRALAHKGQTDLAAESWSLALQADRGHPGALAALVAYNRGKDRLTAAAALAERLASGSGSTRKAGWTLRGLVALAEVRAELGDPGAAAAALRRVTTDRAGRNAERASARPGDPLALPDDAGVRRRLARALLRIGRAAEARDALADADPHDPESAWLESRAGLQLGDLAPAAEALDRSAGYRDSHPTEPEPAPFVGSERCAGCHRSTHSTHRRSLHARTFHRPAELGDLPLPPAGTTDPQDPRLSHTFRRDRDGLGLETRVDDQTFRAVVDYAFGSGDRGLTLVGRDGAGGARELRLSRYGDVSAGWDVTTGHAPRPERPEDGLGRPLSADMARGCLSCHVTDPRSVVERIEPASLDRAIGCERCHGPGGNHVLAVSARGKRNGPEPSPFDDLAIGVEAGLSSPAEINRQCGQCHSPRGGVAARPEDPSSVRFQATTLTWSRCYSESGEALGCLTCHDPHRDASPRAAHYESRCKSCHAGASTSPSTTPSPPLARTTCPVNAREGCLGCHMPVVRTPMIPHSPFTDHFIRARR